MSLEHKALLLVWELGPWGLGLNTCVLDGVRGEGVDTNIQTTANPKVDDMWSLSRRGGLPVEGLPGGSSGASRENREGRRGRLTLES